MSAVIVAVITGVVTLAVALLNDRRATAKTLTEVEKLKEELRDLNERLETCEALKMLLLDKLDIGRERDL